ncbi:MAG: add [Burkholderiales bacterium]|jgi:adenosine deaminase|nr:add [Burkholderiales bacterium]
MALDISFIKKIPKVLLHEHLDGGIRTKTIVEIAKKNKITLPSFDPTHLSKWFIDQSNQKDLYKCLDAFAVSCSVMQDQESISRIAFEFIEDMYLDGVIYAEARYCPFLHTNKGLSMDEVMSAVLAGLNQGKLQYNVDFGVLVCGIRNLGPEINFELTKLAHRYIDKGVVGYDFAGADLDFPLSDNIDTINYLNNHKIPFTVHTGEAAPCDYILEAINLGAARLSHCAKIFDQAKTTPSIIDQSLELIKQNNIHIEINISSNIATGVSDIKHHPFISLFNNGINVALNTDDRLMFGNTLSSEYGYVANLYNLSYSDIKQMNINAAKSAFANNKVKKNITSKIMEFIV